jgi:hypothetical protein
MDSENIIIGVIFIIALFTFGALRLKYLQRHLDEIEKWYEEHPEWFTEDLFCVSG